MRRKEGDPFSVRLDRSGFAKNDIYLFLSGYAEEDGNIYTDMCDVPLTVGYNFCLSGYWNFARKKDTKNGFYLFRTLNYLDKFAPDRDMTLLAVIPKGAYYGIGYKKNEDGTLFLRAYYTPRIRIEGEFEEKIDTNLYEVRRVDKKLGKILKTNRRKR